ncbi:DUF2637 domain-containing protein [Streptomyces sp. H27-H1]|uniref:DUF2637 domain-containing protein n=1 Tax=Streptomyces sp. H27-H1 TaxID=2996461 RepID=UPI002271B9E3|nr:DUF2637 domain-containing protein [Streptomyces sp. H27-H1]MCY0926278.1 DUF2637 domain-containing protein [Streptomyces sp. H27-H1]
MRNRLSRLRDVDPILIQAVIAAAISFSHIHDVAAAAGQDGWKAWAYPVSVDLLLVMAWRRIRVARKAGIQARGPWLWFVLSLAASLGANVATAGVLDMAALPVWLRVTVAGWPVLAFFGGSLLIHSRNQTVVDEVLEVVPEEPQLPAVEPQAEPGEDLPAGPLEEPERPLLRTYTEVADSLGLAVPTIRGWANDGHVKKYPGEKPARVLVDLRECTRRDRDIRRPVSV